MKRLGASLIIWLALGPMAGCGVDVQKRPVPVDVAVPSPQSTVTPQDRGFLVTVYFVRDGRLVPVTRPAPDTSIATALELLVAGPNATEAATGLQTALVPQELTAKTAGDRAVTVTATRDFTGIAGDNQLLATAQLVWSVTENARSDWVRITVSGEAIGVPTDNGLVRRPVERGDYTSVAPPNPPSAPTPQTSQTQHPQTPAPPPQTSTPS